jgi:hypothetical protein
MSDEAESLSVMPSCQLCGSTNLTVPENPTPDSIVECGDCGSQLGRLKDVEARLRKASLEAIENIDTLILDALRRIDADRKK